MTTMNVSFPDELREFVESEVARGGYASADDYLRSLVREAQRRRARRELEARLLEGLQGPAVAMTAEEWDDIRREARAGLEGESILP